MLIQFSCSNFLSFDNKQDFSMCAGKGRKHSKRIHKKNKLKLTKCNVILGANASGKSNLVFALEFMRNMVLNGLPRGFSMKYHRLHPDHKYDPSEFNIKILCDNKIFEYGFSILLSSGTVLQEYLFENTTTDAKKLVFERNTQTESFNLGPFFKSARAIDRLKNYGEDSVLDDEALFLSIINKSKHKMFLDFPELKVLKSIFEWFAFRLHISFPEGILTEYPFFPNTNLEEIAKLLNALGTGITELKIIELPEEYIKNKIPAQVYAKLVSDLEKQNARKHDHDENPQIMVRAYKEFYTFEINNDNQIKVTTIEFSHEKENIYFDLSEESDGTVRLLDLIEILLQVSNDRIFVIDEIDRCLHPALTVKIIELFLTLAEERNTQLIITSHESRLLATDILRNDEVCFIVKNRNGASLIKPLENYQLRSDKKVYAALFDGTLDVIPEFNNDRIDTLLNSI